MKSKVKLNLALVSVLVLVLIIVGCTVMIRIKDVSNQEKTLTSSFNTTDRDVSDQSYFKQLKYGDTIIEIDKDYSEEAFYESDSVLLETEYLEKWNQQLDFLNNEIIKYMTAEEQEKYKQITREWEQYTDDLYGFEYELMVEDGVYLSGSSYRYLSVANKKNAVRERVIYLSYLITFLSDRSK